MANKNNDLNVIMDIFDSISAKTTKNSKKNKIETGNSSIKKEAEISSKPEKKEKSIEDLRKDVLENAQKIYNRNPRPKYVWEGQGPNYYDCSGFSQSIYSKSFFWPI